MLGHRISRHRERHNVSITHQDLAAWKVAASVSRALCDHASDGEIVTQGAQSQHLSHSQQVISSLFSLDVSALFLPDQVFPVLRPCERLGQRKSPGSSQTVAQATNGNMNFHDVIFF